MKELGRVLVVDDSEDDHLQIRRVLRGHFHVTAAWSGAEALERLEREPDAFDVLVTDQIMPRMAGDALIRRVKADPRFARVRCILLSGQTSNEQLVEILRDGAVFHYFDKGRTLLYKDGQAELLIALRNAAQASRLEAERTRLNQRLRAQVEALSGQYKLFKTLVGLKDPAQILRLVIQSLAQRLPCRAALGLVDLLPDQGAFGYVATAPGGPVACEGELAAWQGWARDAYARLSGRTPGPALVFGRSAEPSPGGAPAPVPDDAPHVPVFVDRDLRGLLVLIRDDGAPFEDEEVELLDVWRDQLQDALTRVYTQVLDQQRRLELMVEAMSEGVVMTDEGGAVTLINRAARRMLEIADAERPDLRAILAAMGMSTVDLLRQFGPGETIVHWREIRLGEGHQQVMFSPVRDHSGAFVGVLVLLRDVTDQKRAEQRREEFVHIIGHELRSPLTSIGGVLDLLAKSVLGELSGRQREYVEMARDSCVKINHILNDLLDLAKFEKGKMPLSIETVNLEEVARDAVRKFEPVAIERGVLLSFECETQGLVCQADAYRIGQVMNNLLSNALKFTPSGGRVIVTVFTAFAVPDAYLVSVHNTGDEISEGDLDRIFDKFEQVDVGDRRSLGGTGLGLSICRNIVAGHGGTIWVESRQGEGTNFVFMLPAAPGVADLEEGEGPAAGGSLYADGRPLLVVSPDLREALALKGLLLRLGFRVRLCRPDPADVHDRVTALRPPVAVYLDPEDAPGPEVLAALAAFNELAVVAMLQPGAMAPGPVDLALELPAEPLALASILSVVLLRQRQRRRMRVLVVDRDAGWASRIAGQLDDSGYLAYTARTAAEAVRRVEVLLPDVVLLDPELSGAAQVLEHLQGDTGDEIPILFTGEGGLGGDADGVPRDLDPRDLALRVRTRLAEARRRGVDSLIILPGPRELEREVQVRQREARPYAYCTIDIEGLHAAMQHQGFMWGHAVMAQTAELVHRVLRDRADERAFLGHQRDDDFVLLVGPEHCEAVAREIVRAFDRLEPLITAGHAGAAPPPIHERLRLVVTAIVDWNGRFDSYAALQAEMARARGRDTGEVLFIDRGARAVAPPIEP